MVGFPFPAPTRILEKFSVPFRNFSRRTSKKSKIGLCLRQASMSISAEHYVALSIGATFFSFLFLFILLFLLFFLSKTSILNSLFYSFIASFMISIFIYVRELNYPKLLSSKRTRDIEKNLLPALRALLIQLDSGLTFFDALKSIARSNYGTISEEFTKLVNDMQTGVPTTDALEKISSANPSKFFRRSIWQIKTGMQEGADISVVLHEIIDSLSAEQIVEIQAYGGRLSPLSMFYMLFAIILPALGITFITIISSFIPIFSTGSKLILYALYACVVFLQFIFLGMIRTKRPALI